MSSYAKEGVVVDIFQRLEKCGYIQPLQKLSVALDGKLWLIGGWVRSAFLGISQYAGDVDCLCLLSEKEIASRLSTVSTLVSRNRNKGFRVSLVDCNHIDIVCADHLTSSGTIEGALDTFNFSINSAAVKIDDGTFECTQRFTEDVDARTFQLNDGFVQRPEQKRRLFEDAEGFIYHYGLRPKAHKPTTELLAEIRDEKQSLCRLSLLQKLDSARLKVCKLLGPLPPGWLVRGYLRCSLLGVLEYWDDLDVVVKSTKKDLLGCIEQQGYEYIENYWGNPKILLEDGTTVDIWSLPDGYRIEDELASYSHNVDAVAWHVGSETLHDPLGIHLGTTSQEVEVMERYIRVASKRDLAYTSLKTAYLCIRHNLKPGARARALLRSNLPIDGFLQANAARLSKDLSCATEGKVSEWIDVLKSELGASPALDSILQFLNRG